MSEEKLSNFSQVLLWLGAAISLAEILTGALIAPLGLGKGMLAIFLGHLIGGVILYFTGLIGAQSKLPAIKSTRISFGKYGSYVFSVLNVIQLVGWTAIMIINGAKAFDVVTARLFGFRNEILWCVLIAGLIMLWILVGFKNIGKISFFAVGALFLFTLLLGWLVFFGGGKPAPAARDTLSFGAAVELSVIMPLSWLPLIADYTSKAKHEKTGAFSSAAGYFTGSVFMYTIGLGTALFAGSGDIAMILSAAGLSVAALFIILFSTITTTFLDVYSAAVSFLNITKKWGEKTVSVVVCLFGLALAVLIPITAYESFLYVVGSVFAPLFAVLLTDYFILKKNKMDTAVLFNIKNALLAVFGVAVYYVLLKIDLPLGTTLPTMLIVAVFCLLVEGGQQLCLKK